MNRNEILTLLAQKGIVYELSEHPAVYNMKEVEEIHLPYPEDDAKNLFVRDDRKRQYYLITLRGNKRADLKSIRRAEGTRPLSFASDADLEAILCLTPGSVTPLGLLNDEEHRVIFFLDEDCLKAERIGVHPNDNTATLWLLPQDLVSLITSLGNEVRIIQA